MSADQNRNAKRATWDSFIASFYFALPYSGILGILEEIGIGRVSLTCAFLLAIPVAGVAWLLEFLTRNGSMKNRIIVCVILILLVFGVRMILRYTL